MRGVEAELQRWSLQGGGVDECVNASVCECGPLGSCPPPVGSGVRGWPSVA